MSIETFYLQYFFPPSSVGETGRVGPAGELLGASRGRGGVGLVRVRRGGVAACVFLRPAPADRGALPTVAPPGRGGGTSTPTWDVTAGAEAPSTWHASPLHQDNPQRFSSHNLPLPPFTTPSSPHYRDLTLKHTPCTHIHKLPGRRELGHGELAQRALAPVIPSKDDFPYTVSLCVVGAIQRWLKDSGSSSSLSTHPSTAPPTSHCHFSTSPPLSDPRGVHYHREQRQQQHGVSVWRLLGDAGRRWVV
jgi:hypothetical protein